MCKNFLYIVSVLFILVSNVYAKKDILVIESYHAQYPWDISYKNGLKQVLGEKYNLIFFEMNTKRITAENYQLMANKAWKKYKTIKPELVILGDDNALKYLGHKFSKTKTKVVCLGINNNPRAYNVAGFKNITGILERPLLKRSIMHLSNILKVQNVLILFDSGTTANVIKETVFNNKNSVKVRGVNIDLKLVDKYEVWKNEVNNAKHNGYDIIIVGLYHTIKDNDEKHVKDSTVLNWTSQNATIPPFAFWDFAVGKNKTIGGYVLFGEAQGVAAGKMALKLMTKKDDSLILPKTAEMGRFLFSNSQLKKWSLNIEDKINLKIEYVK